MSVLCGCCDCPGTRAATKSSPCFPGTPRSVSPVTTV
uniref:Uncharacterized protein n=1 Tax=Triticum urartu TaxID=4572 RepID=A0A8R7US40_TRIUA